jgi:hypothetical protein
MRHESGRTETKLLIRSTGDRGRIHRRVEAFGVAVALVQETEPSAHPKGGLFCKDRIFGAAKLERVVPFGPPIDGLDRRHDKLGKRRNLNERERLRLVV